MSLPFLRPLALPRPSNLRSFLLPIVRNLSTTTALAKPYRITRTATNGMPVYLLSKRGGNLKQTKLRRIEGDINVLRSDLQFALGVEEKDVVINQLTKHIIVRGHKKQELCKFLEEHKF